MIVIALSCCPNKLRGDLTKWLMEIDTGVYVGQVSARVRDGLWNRVCENAGRGKAVMVYSDQNEQGFSLRVHNTAWMPMDFDGVTLMQRPLPPEKKEKPLKAPVPRKRQLTIEAVSAPSRQERMAWGDYTVIDLETTGLARASDVIMELAALRVRNWKVERTFHCLIRVEKELPRSVEELTGITAQLLFQQGVPLSQALPDFLEFIGRDVLVCHYAPFDTSFLQAACDAMHLEWRHGKILDTRTVAKEKSLAVSNYKLITLARHLGISESQAHRALSDCNLIHQVYLKLNEIGD